MSLIVCTFMVSPFQQNARVVVDTTAKKALVIDPGDEVERIYDWVVSQGASVESIFLTHCHIDHAGGVKRLLAVIRGREGAVPLVYYHKNDQMIADNISSYAMMSGLDPQHYCDVPKPFIDLEGKTTFSFSEYTFDLRFVPGHSPGHVVLYLSDADVSFQGDFVQQVDVSGPLLIAGDTLFRGSIGRTDLPGGDHSLLITSIRTQLLSLPEHTIVLSGHGPNTSIGFEREHNPFL